MEILFIHYLLCKNLNFSRSSICLKGLDFLDSFMVKRFAKLENQKLDIDLLLMEDFGCYHRAGGNAYGNIGVYGSNTFEGAGHQFMNMGRANPDKQRGPAIRSYSSSYGNPELEHVYLVSHIQVTGIPEKHRT